MKTIIKIAPRQFVVTTPGAGERGSDFKMTLDFNPIIDALSDREKSYNDYQIFHWQGTPAGFREWGIYDPIADTYKCSVFENTPTMYGGSRLVMLDDTTATTKPSAVIYFVGSDALDGAQNISYSQAINREIS